MIIREMTPEDIDAVLVVDKAAFKKAWDENEFKDEAAKDYSDYFVVLSENKIIGYAGIWCIYETAELIRIATHPDFRGIGGAKQLMNALLSKAKEKKCEKIMLEVRKSNISAQMLYKHCGFKETAVRRGYYDGEDALILEREL